MSNKECIHVPFEELGVVLCKASNKRKIKSAIFNKLRLETIPIFYRKLGYVFRSATDSKLYYSMEEVEELFKKYVESIH